MDKSQVDMIFELATKMRDARTNKRHASQQDEAHKRLEALRAENAARIEELTAKKDD